MLCGLFLIGLFVFIGYKDSEATIVDTLTGVIVGTFICIFGIAPLLFNFRAYFYIDDDNIKGKYHYFSKIDCKVTDVVFVLPQINTLTILLKNGKRHTISGIENAWELSSEIRRKNFHLETKAPDDVRLELDAAQATRKKELFCVLGGFVLMFVNILIAVLLTGGREMYDFSKLDWSLFAVMCFIEVLTVIATFYFAGKYGKQRVVIEHFKYQLKGAKIASQPLPAGNPIRIYAEENHTGRLVVFDIPNSRDVYYCVQEFLDDTGFQLDTVYTSKIYESEEALDEEADFHILIDITEHFQ